MSRLQQRCSAASRTPIDTNSIIGLRDRALIGVMVYAFARVGAVVAMRVEDYFPQGKRWWMRLHEKGGKRHDVPAHHLAEAYLDAYLEAAAIADKRVPLFQTVDRARVLTGKVMARQDVFRMIKRRARQAGVSTSACCHTFPSDRDYRVSVQWRHAGARSEDCGARVA